MRQTVLRCVSLLFALTFGQCCLAQAVTVRVVNANNGRPLQDQRVSLSLLYEKGEPAPVKSNSNLSSETDSDGQVHFELPEPPPAHLSVQVGIDSRRWHCACGVLAATQDVVRKGIVESAASADDARRLPSLMNPVPGEIRFLARPLSFWERLLAPLLRG